DERERTAADRDRHGTGPHRRRTRHRGGRGPAGRPRHRPIGQRRSPHPRQGSGAGMNSTPATGQVQPRRLLPAAPRVVFIGSGPGESSLMTMRGAEILVTAVTVVYDAGVHSEIVTAYAPQAATLIDAADHGVPAPLPDRPVALQSTPVHASQRTSADTQ